MDIITSTIRARVAEFRRLMYQHAALKQFERNQSNDFLTLDTFIVDYKEDGEFAKQLWLSEYVPSMMDVIDDIRNQSSKQRSRTQIREHGEKCVLHVLEEGQKKRSELIQPTSDEGISVSELDNVILPSLIWKGSICKPTGFGSYMLKNCEKCEVKESCRSPTKE